MKRLLALCVGLLLIVGASAAPDQAPGTRPGDFVAFDAPAIALTGALLIDGDPIRDPQALRKVQWVFKDGIGYDAAKLRESARGDVGTR